MIWWVGYKKTIINRFEPPFSYLITNKVLINNLSGDFADIVIRKAPKLTQRDRSKLAIICAKYIR